MSGPEIEKKIQTPKCMRMKVWWSIDKITINHNYPQYIDTFRNTKCSQNDFNDAIVNEKSNWLEKKI